MLEEIILIDDDKIVNLTNQKIITQLLPQAKIRCFENGEAALTYMLNTIDDQIKTLVLVDINMPVMNGFEFLSIYENVIAYQEHSFVVSLLTSSHDETDYTKAKKYPSVLEYTTKPFTKAKMQVLLEQALDRFCVTA